MPVQAAQKRSGDNKYFHIYNEVVEERRLFNDQEDYKTFLNFLNEYLSPPPDPHETKKTFSVKGKTFKGVPHQPKNYFGKVELVAYSLLPNHFHLVVNQKHPGSIEKLIRSLSTRYAIYYNKKYQRKGSIFQGPYKSVQVKNITQLTFLTRYIHRESLQENDKNNKVFSSYEEYVGLRNTSWVKPNIVLSNLKNAQNGDLREVKSYKNFVESHEYVQKQKELLEEVLLERKVKHSAKSAPKHDVSVNKTPPPGQVYVETPAPQRPRTTEFIAAASFIFILLFGVGIRNVMTYTPGPTESIAVQPTPASQVSGAKTNQETENAAVQDEAQEVEKVITQSPDTPSTQKVIIVTSDDSLKVNIRKEPSTESEIIDSAQNGDSFEYISTDSGWYQIKLDDGKSAFVFAQFSQLEEE